MIASALRRLVSLFRGRGLPADPAAEWAYAERAGDALGRRAADSRRDGGRNQSLDADVKAYAEHVSGTWRARCSRFAARYLRVHEQQMAKGDKKEGKSKHHERVAAEHDGERKKVDAEAGTTLDLFLSSVLAYVGSYVAIIVILETTGMLTSLSAFDATLGEMRKPMSIAAGAILLLAGHGIGKLLHAALREKSRVKLAFVVAAFVTLVLGIVAINEMGTARDVNVDAGAMLVEAGQLDTEARKLSREADKIEAVGTGQARARRLRSAEAQQIRSLRHRAEVTAERASRLRESAFDRRTMAFFIAVQTLGLAVGALGGFFYARTEPIRRRRHLGRCLTYRRRRATTYHGRAQKRYARAGDAREKTRRVVSEEAGWAESCHGHFRMRYSVAGGGVLEPLVLDRDRLLADLLPTRPQQPAVTTPQEDDSGAMAPPEHNGAGEAHGHLEQAAGEERA